MLIPYLSRFRFFRFLIDIPPCVESLLELSLLLLFIICPIKQRPSTYRIRRFGFVLSSYSTSTRIRLTCVNRRGCQFRSLTTLATGRHVHSALDPNIFDPLHDLQLVPQRHVHLLEVFIVQFKDRFQVFDAVVNEQILVL